MVDSLADVVYREILLKFLVVLKGVVPLRKAGAAGVEPAIHNERLACHLTIALAATQFHCIDVGAVQVFRDGVGINSKLAQLSARANAMLVAAFTAPDREWCTPEPFAADGPVFDVLEPFAEPFFAHPSGSPLYLRIVRQ